MQIKAKMYAKKKTGEKKLKGFEKGMEKNWYSQTLLVWGRSQHLCFSMWISNDLAHQEHCIFINHVIAHKGVFIDSNLCSWPFALPHTCTHLHQNHIYLITIILQCVFDPGCVNLSGLLFCSTASAILDLWVSLWILEFPPNLRRGQHWASKHSLSGILYKGLATEVDGRKFLFRGDEQGWSWREWVLLQEAKCGWWLQAHGAPQQGGLLLGLFLTLLIEEYPRDKGSLQGWTSAWSSREVTL